MRLRRLRKDPLGEDLGESDQDEARAGGSDCRAESVYCTGVSA